MRAKQVKKTRPVATEALRLGERLRQLRFAAGLTQSDVAGDRFSKEYVAQIERGKTRPTRETIEWLAARLGVDTGFLATGVASDERGRLEGALARAEALYEAGDDADAANMFELLVPAARATGSPELQVRALVGTALARCGSATIARRSSSSATRGRSRSPDRSPTSSGPTCSSGSGAAATS